MRAAQSSGEKPGSRTTLREACFLTVVGARVLLLRPVLLLVGGARRPEATEGGVRRELVLDRESWRVGGALFGWGFGRERGIGGGGIEVGVLVVVVLGVVGCCGDDVAEREGACILG